VEESERRFSAAFAQAPVGMVLTTPDGHIVEANQAYLDMLGYSREELMTRDSSNFTYPADIEPTRRFYRRFQTEGIHTDLIEKRYIRKNGEIV
jgi:PAS domain S-box-containing protein